MTPNARNARRSRSTPIPAGTKISFLRIVGPAASFNRNARSVCECRCGATVVRMNGDLRRALKRGDRCACDDCRRLLGASGNGSGCMCGGLPWRRPEGGVCPGCLEPYAEEPPVTLEYIASLPVSESRVWPSKAGF